MNTQRERVSKSEPSLPSSRAFVVQFRATGDQTQPLMSGRVEHVASGQTIRFESWQQLQQFIEKTLAGVADKPP